MTYLATQIWLCLLIAFLLGLLLGWFLWGRTCRRKLEELEASLRGDLDDCRRSLSSARAEADEQKAQRVRAFMADTEMADTEMPETEMPETEMPEMGAVSQSFVGATPTGAARVDERPDDLKKVEGIGPKIEALLNDDDILTWNQLAETAVDQLQDILDRAGPRYRVHDPASWPDQARLAGEGRWDELEDLQGRLKGGRAT